MVVLQSVVAYVFLERHYNLVTQRLSAGVVQDIATLIEVYKTYPQDRRQCAASAHRAGKAWPGGRLPAGQRPAAARPEAVFLADRSGAVGGNPQADRSAVLDRYRRALGAGRDPHQARQRGDPRVRAAQCRLCIELPHLPGLDGRHLAGADHGRRDVPAQPDPPDPAACRCGRKLRQGARGAELPPARRARGSPRRLRVPRNEEPDRAQPSSSAPPCWPACRTTCAPS